MKISVSLSYSLGEPLTYRAEVSGLTVGARILVPLGRSIALGWVVGLDSPYRGRLKEILGVIDDPFYPGAELLEFARQAAAAYFTSAGSILDLCLPPSQKNPKRLRLETNGGERALAEFSAMDLARLAASGPLRLFFKHPTPIAAGITARAAAAAGPNHPWPKRLLLSPRRDEAYREACADVLAAGESVILAVPDNATAGYWQKTLASVIPYHSGISAAAREKAWSRLQQGEPAIVCGGLAALALPLPRPGLLILDRSSSPLYRRTGATPLRVDHLAEIRAVSGSIPLLRGAAGHSCATVADPQDGRIDDRRPEHDRHCRIHMLKGRERGIPAEIVDLVRDNFLAGKKTLVLVNRIQPAVYLFCPVCRRLAACPRCGGVLQVDAANQASCRRCSFRREALNDCPRCGKPLEPLHDISIDSLARAVERVCGEAAVLSLTTSELKDADKAQTDVNGHAVVIATLAALSPHFAGLFAAALWVKPESFFAMEEYDAAESIFACGAEIAATLAAGGELHVFSVFHFHYALQLLNDETAFFEREMKYRQWFRLPPFAAVYELELRDASLRSLGAAMRGLYREQRDRLQVKRAYLISRQKRRGTYRGILELHASTEAIAAAGVHRLRRSSLRRIAG